MLEYEREREVDGVTEVREARRERGWERERKGGWFGRGVGEGQGERGVEVVREVESNLFFLHPQVCSSSFP